MTDSFNPLRSVMILGAKCALSLALLSASAVAAAEEAPSRESDERGASPSDAQAEREGSALLNTLRYHADQQRSGEVFGGIGLLAAGAASGALSVGLFYDDSEMAPFALGIGIVGGGIGTLLLAGVIENPMEKTAESYLAGEKRGTPKAELVRTVEQEWRRRATASQSQRQAGGGLLLAMGGLSFGEAAFHGFVESSVDSSHPSYRPLLTYLSLFNGLLMSMEGAVLLATDDPVKAAYEAYSRTKGLVKPPVQIAPTASITSEGAMFGVTGRF